MSLSDIEQRILNKLDDFGRKVDDLCNRLTKVEASLDNHYQDINKENTRKNDADKKIQIKREWDTKKFYIIVTIISTSITIYTIVRSFFL